jgi:hypothetical protein
MWYNGGMDVASLHTEQQWPYLLTLVPQDYVAWAREAGAWQRGRGVANPAVLLRLLLAYAVTDLSLKDVAAWAHATGVAAVSGPALFYRVRDAEAWLSRLLSAMVTRAVGDTAPGRRVRIVDATVLTGPGATGTEYRVHLSSDPTTGRFGPVDLTDAHGGEGLARHSWSAGDVVLGDRAYATARGFAAVAAQQADVLVRLNPHTIRLCDRERRPLAVVPLAAAVPPTGGAAWDVLVPVPPDPPRRHWALSAAAAWLPARLCGGRTRDGAVIWLLTTLPASSATPTDCLALYRVRWQVELVFKRLKSLLGLDTLPCRQGPTARSWILARLLAAALAQQLLDPAGAFSPWGYPIGADTQCLVTLPHDPLGLADRDSGTRRMAVRAHTGPR